MTRSLPLLVLMCLFFGLQSPTTQAQVLWTDLDDVIEVEIRPGWRDATGRHFAALEFRLAQGWTTYWRSPGSAGIAPMFNWRGTRNIKDVKIHWPVPEIGSTAGHQTLGYRGQLLLPLELRVTDENAPVRLKAQLDVGVCSDICLPARLQVSAVLPPSGQADGEISASLANRPKAGNGTVTCRLSPTADGIAVTAQIPLPRPLGNAEAVAVEMAHARGQIWIADTQVTRRGANLSTRTEFILADGAGLAIDRNALRSEYAVDDGDVADLPRVERVFVGLGNQIAERARVGRCHGLLDFRCTEHGNSRTVRAHGDAV